MKNFIYSSLLITNLFIIGCTGADYPVINVKVSHVYDIDSLNKSQIYNKLLKWISLNTRWSKSVIDYKDNDVGTIVVKAKVSAWDEFNKIYIQCIFEFNTKDNKVKLDITNNDDEHFISKYDLNEFKKSLENISKDVYEYLKKKDDF